MSWQPPHTPVTISLPAPSGKFAPGCGRGAGCWAAAENTEPKRAAATSGNSDREDIRRLRGGCIRGKPMRVHWLVREDCVKRAGAHQMKSRRYRFFAITSSYRAVDYSNAQSVGRRGDQRASGRYASALGEAQRPD